MYFVLGNMQHPVDSRIQRLVFQASETEHQTYVAWYREHEKTCQGSTGAIGGKYTFSFTPTGLGDVVKVSCGLCGEVKDCTDFDQW